MSDPIIPERIYHYNPDVKLIFVQKDRGFSIPGCPVGCDFDVHDDYSLGKFEAKYDL